MIKMFSTQYSSISDDQLASRLPTKVSEITSELQESLKTHLDEMQILNQDTKQYQIVLKAELNKLRSENIQKLKIFHNIKQEIESFEANSYRSNQNSSDRIHSIDPVQEKLDMEFLSVQNDLEIAENEQDCIKGMLRKEKDSIIILKERLQELNEAHRKITKSYSLVTYSDKKARNNLILVKNQIANLRKDMKRRKNEYQSSYALRQNFKLNNIKAINNLIEKMSYNSLQNLDKKEKNQVIIKDIKEKIEIFDKNFNIKQNYLKNLEMYQYHIKIIKKVIKRSGLGGIKDLDKGGTISIIESYNHLKYQESSLSSKFQTLATECLEKKNDYEKTLKELLKLKEENSKIILNENSAPQTLNQLKEFIEDDTTVASKFEKTLQLEEVLLKLYLGLLNVAVNSMKFMTKIKESVNVMENDLKADIKNASSELDSLKQGFFSKRDLKNSQSTRRQLQKSIDYSDFNPEYYNKQIVPYFSLTFSEISSACNIVFNSLEQTEKFAGFIKNHLIICSFVTPGILTEYLKNSKAYENAYQNIDELNEKGHSEYKNQYFKLCTLTSDIIIKIKRQQENSVSQIKSFFNDYTPDSASFFDKIMKNPKRRSFKVPTIIKDRVKPSQPDLHENKEQPYKTFEVTVKGNKKENKFEQLSDGINAFKSNRLISLESPKDVLKEVLRIEKEIKKIKSDERKAEIKDLTRDTQSLKMLKQPWSPKSPRPYTQNRGLRARLLIGSVTPKLNYRKLNRKSKA